MQRFAQTANKGTANWWYAALLDFPVAIRSQHPYTLVMKRKLSHDQHALPSGLTTAVWKVAWRRGRRDPRNPVQMRQILRFATNFGLLWTGRLPANLRTLAAQ
jgi:hypothetical protein